MCVPVESEADVLRTVAPSNPGASRAVGTSKTRVDCLKEGIVDFPNLIRLVDGLHRGGVSHARFERRSVDVSKWEGLLREVAGEAVVDVFGSWAEWSWPPEAMAWVEPMQDPLTFANGEGWPVDFLVDAVKLAAYVAEEKDSRQTQVEEFLARCEADGTVSEDDGLTKVPHMGHQKIVNGGPLGRYYFGKNGYPTLSKQARAAAYPIASVEFDMPNAVVHFACALGKDKGLSLVLMQKYVAHKDAWRKAVCDYYGLGLEDAKKLLLKACYGFSFPGQLGVCPLLDGLAAEGVRLREAVAASEPGLVEALRSARRPRPETSAVALKLMDAENKWMREFVSLLTLHHYRLVATVYDAVIALPTEEWNLDDEEGLLTQFHTMCGLRMQVRQCLDIAGSRGVSCLLEGLVSGGRGCVEGPRTLVPGNFMCIPTAVINVLPEADPQVRKGMEGQEGPFSYAQFCELCPEVALEPVAVGIVPDGSVFLLHEALEKTFAHCGHAFGVKVAGTQTVVCSSEHPECWRVSTEALWQGLGALPGLKLLRT